MPRNATYDVGSEPIAGFRLVEHLGRGLFGEVWSADDEGAGRVVAVKVVDLTFSGGSVNDFRALGRMTTLAHPHLMPVFTTRLKDKAGKVLDPEQAEVARQRGELKELVIVMGLGEKSLAERLREVNPEGTPVEDRQGLPVEELFRYLLGAAKGLDYLHQDDHGLAPDAGDGPVLHCGVKPRNLFIFAGEVRVSDAGLFALLAPNLRQTLSIGNPAYTAPELAANQPGPAADQYALGVCYYELRTGRLPFDEGMGHTSILLAHAHGRLDFASPALTEAEREVLKRATAMHPSDRYPTCLKMVRDLSRAAEKLFPDQTTRTLRDTQGVPYPSPLRPESYWQAILLPPDDPGDGTTVMAPAPARAAEPPARATPVEVIDPLAPGQYVPSAASMSAFEISVSAAAAPKAPPPPPPAAPEYKLSYASVRATPILLPVDPTVGGPGFGTPPEILSLGDDSRSSDPLIEKRGPLIPAAVPPPPAPRPPVAPDAPLRVAAKQPEVKEPPPVKAEPPPAPAPPPPVPTPQPEPPAWFREAQAGGPKSTPAGRVARPSSAAVIPRPSDLASVAGRQVTVRYSAWMTPRRVFPLDVELSAWHLREGARAAAGPVGFLEVEPILPGCFCNPRRAALAVGAAGEPTVVTFSVVPHAFGRADRARVVIRHAGQVLAELPLAVAVGTRAWAWACGAAGLLAPFAVIGLRGLPLDPSARRASGVQVYEAVGRWVANHVPPELVGFGLLAAAAGLFVHLRPRPAVVTRELTV